MVLVLAERPLVWKPKSILGATKTTTKYQGVLPSNKVMGMFHWVGSYFHDLITTVFVLFNKYFIFDSVIFHLHY